jgi:hypothetical protein
VWNSDSEEREPLGVYGTIPTSSICVFQLDLNGTTNWMNFNVTKGRNTDYLTGLYLFDTNSSMVIQSAELMVGTPIEICPANNTDVFFFVLYPIATNAEDFFIKTEWVRPFPWWGILLIILGGLCLICCVIIIIIIIIVVVIKVVKGKNGGGRSSKGRSVDDGASSDGRDVRSNKSGGSMKNTYGNKR